MVLICKFDLALSHIDNLAVVDCCLDKRGDPSFHLIFDYIFLQRHSPIKCSIKSDRNKVRKWILKFVVQQLGANLDAESVKMFTGHRVIKRSGGLSGCSGLFLRFLHPFR